MSSKHREETSLHPSKRTLGVLQILSENDQILDQSIFPLKSGDNYLGSGHLCDIILPYSSIDEMLCKISLNPDNEFTIEDLDSKIGIYRTLHDQVRQRLKANKVYDLYPEKPFYIGDQYRCVFRPAPSKKYEEHSGEASPLQLTDYQKPQKMSQYRRSTPSRSPSPEAQTEIPQTLPIASLEQEMDELDAYHYQASPAKPSTEKAQLRVPTKPSDFVNSLFHDDYYNASMAEEEEEEAETPVKAEHNKASPFTKNFKRKNTGLKSETRETEPEFEQPREKIEESSLRAGSDAKAGLQALLGKKKVEEDEDEDRADTVSISDDDEPEAEPEEERLPEENLHKEAEENSNNSVSFVKHFTKKGKTAPTPADELPGRRKEEKITEIPSSFTGLEDDEATSFALTTAKKPEKVSKKKEKTPKKVVMEEEDDEEDDPLKLIPRAKPVEVRKEALEIEDIDIEEEDNKGKKKGRLARKEGKKPEEKPKKKEIEEEKPKKVIEEEKPKKIIEEEKQKRGQRKAVEEEKEKKVTPIKEPKSPISKGKEQVIHEEPKGKNKKGEDVTPIKEQKSPISKRKEQVVHEEPKGRNKKVEDVTPRKSQRETKNKASEEIEEEQTGRGMRSKRSTEKAKEQEEKVSKAGKNAKQVGSPDTKAPMKVTPIKGKNKEENEGTRGSRNEKIAGSPDTKTTIKSARNEKMVGSPDTKTPIRAARNERKVGSPDTLTSVRDVTPVRGKKKEENKQEEEVKKGRVSQRLAKKSAEKDDDEEEEPEEAPKRGRKAQKIPEKKAPEVKKSTRGKSRVEEEEEEKSISQKETDKRKGRGKSKVQEEEENPKRNEKKGVRGKSRIEEEEEEEEPISKKETDKRRGRGKSQVQDEEEEEEEKPIIKRGTRGKSKVQEEEEEPRRKKEPEKKKEKETKGKTAQKEEKKRGRKPAKVIEMEVEEEEEEEPEPKPEEVPKKGRKGRKVPEKKEPEVKKNTRGKSRIEEEEEEEPEEAPKRGRKAKKTPEKKEPEAKKNARGKRSAPHKEDDEEPITEKKRKTSKAAAAKKNSQEVDPNLLKRNAYRVLFSGFAVNDKKVANAKKNLKTIGVNISEDMDNFNVLVMSELRRTIKFLFAVSQGASVVSFDWVTDSLKEGHAVAPDDYLFEDESIESTHHFKLNGLLKRVRRGEKDLLKGIHVWLPTNIKPSYEEVKTLIEGIQGTVLKTKPGKYKEDVIILVNEGDEKQAKHFVDVGFKVHTTELIYSGILQQKLNFGQNQVKVKGK